MKRHMLIAATLWAASCALTGCSENDATGAQDIGAADVMGPRGPQGVAGERGQTGAQGETGPRGGQGDVGPQGATGATGPQGDPGATGSQGDPGATGAAGPQGETGLQGEPGMQGEPGTPGDAGPQGEQGVPGDQGTPGAAGPQGDKGDKGDKGDPGEAPAIETPMTPEQEAKFNTDNVACVGCHSATASFMVEDYKLSSMAKAGVTCEDCHLANPAVTTGEGHRLYPTPVTCAKCHPNQFAGHMANRHSVGMVRQVECGRFDDFPTEFKVGSGYHFDQADVDQLSNLMNLGSQGTSAQKSPMSAQMCGQCHNVETRCDSCHTRHRFSIVEARDPSACGTCHMGPDHPHIEMYEHSKHGVKFGVFGDAKGVPGCVDCHMPYSNKMLGKKTAADGTKYTDHNLSLGIAYGPIGGGTKRQGFTADPTSGRVRFARRDAAAPYAEIWMDRTDGKFYDAANGGTVVFADLWTASIADSNANGKQDYALDAPTDSAPTLEASRDFMTGQVCAKCHSKNFAEEQLLIADLVHENAIKVQDEGWDIIRAMAMCGILSVDPSDTPANPETGVNGTFPSSMKIRNLTGLEKMYFTAMKYEVVKTWKGAFHMNPDYTHWYGWTALNMTLGEMGDEATDDVLLNLWIQGKVYPGPAKDVVSDAIYQGTLYDTATMTNLYDKYPGPNDTNLTNYGQPIDVDMDGTAEFQPVAGKPGTYVKDGVEVVFH